MKTQRHWELRSRKQSSRYRHSWQAKRTSSIAALDAESQGIAGQARNDGSGLLYPVGFAMTNYQINKLTYEI
jgi:hypothetical protein